MAQIPIYTSQVPAQGLGVVPQASTYPRDERTGSLSQGAGALASGLNTYAEGAQAEQNALDRSQERQDHSRVSLAISDARAKLTREMFADHERIFNTGPYPQGFENVVPKYDDRVRDLTTNVLDGIKSPKAQAFAREQMRHLQNEVVLPKTLAMRADAQVRLNIYQTNGTLANNAQTVDSDPSQYTTIRDSQQDAIVRADIPFDEKAKLLETGKKMLTHATLFAQVRTNFRDFIGAKQGATALADEFPGVAESIDGTTDDAAGVTGKRTPRAARDNGAIASQFPAWADATPELRETIRRHAEALSNQADAAKLGAFTQRMKDDIAAARNGQPPLRPIDPEVFTQMYGPNSGQAQAYYKWQAVGKVVQTMGTMSNATIDEALNDLRPHEGEKMMEQHVLAFNALLKEASAVKGERRTAQLADIKANREGTVALILAGHNPPPMDESEFAGLAPEVYQGYTRTLHAAQLVRDLPNMSREDIEKEAKALDLTGDVDTAVAEASVRDIFLKAREQDAKLRDDSASYVLQPGSPLSNLHDAAFGKDSTPTIRDNYFLATKAEQQRLMGTYAFTTKVERAGIETALNAPVRGDGAGDDMVARMKALQGRYGRFFPEVVQELQYEHKKLPESFYGIAGTDSAAVQEQVARLGNVKEHDLTKTLDSAKVKEARDAMTEAFAPMVASLPKSEGNTAMLNGLYDSALKIAFADMAGGGDPAKLAKRAADAFTSMYGYFKNEGGESNYMVPKGEQPARVNMGATLALGTLPRLKLLPPPDASGLYKGDEGAKEWVADIQRAPTWRISNDGEGLGLFARTRGGKFVPVLTPSGKQLTYSWESLRGFVTDSRSYSAAPTPAQREAAAAVFREGAR